MPSSQSQTETTLPPIVPATGIGLANEVPKAEDKKPGQPSGLTFEKVLRSYLVPLAVLSIFGGMLLFLIIPKIGDIVAQLDQTNAAYDQARTLDKQLLSLSDLQTQAVEFQDSLNTINQIAPSGATEVVNFQKKIQDMAKLSTLTVQQSTLEESIKTSQDKTSTSNLGIIEIPSTFSLRGQFANLQKFVQQIRTLSDFVIIGEMALRANIDTNALNSSATISGTADDWTLIITLIKYQFLIPTAQNQLALVFQRVSPDLKIDQEVIEFANTKVATTPAPVTDTSTGDQSQTDTDQTVDTGVDTTTL